MFITGGAGVGKSFLIALIHEFLERAHRGASEFGSGRASVLCAPTGGAAFNINGQTIHSAMKIPVGLLPIKAEAEPRLVAILTALSIEFKEF